jgi:hypothetical protein
MIEMKEDGASPCSEVLTLRDYFAAQAMQGMMVENDDPVCDYIAKRAYKMADAMLVERQK